MVCHQEADGVLAVPRALPVAFLLRPRLPHLGKEPAMPAAARGGGHRPALCKLWVLGSGGGWTVTCWGRTASGDSGDAVWQLHPWKPEARLPGSSAELRPCLFPPCGVVLAPALGPRVYRVRRGVPGSERGDVIITAVRATAAPRDVGDLCNVRVVAGMCLRVPASP